MFINVAARIRIEPNSSVVCVLSSPQSSITVTEGSNTRSFNVATFNSQESSRNIYNQQLSPVIDQVLRGYDGYIILYGPSESGKSFTMFESANGSESLLEQTVKSLFERATAQHMILVSMYQVSENKLVDLLDPNTRPCYLKIVPGVNSKSGKILLHGVSELHCENAAELMRLANQGRYVYNLLKKNSKVGQPCVFCDVILSKGTTNLL